MFKQKELFMSSPIQENELLETGIHEKIEQLLEYVKSSAGKEEIHIVEKEIFQQIKQIGRASLQLFVEKSGTGYEANNPPISENGNNLENKVCPASPYFSIYGKLNIKRTGYYDKAKQRYYYPIDNQLNLPKSTYSYLLTDWLLSRSTETDYRESVNLFIDIFDIDLSQAVPQRLCEDISPSVQPYYDQADAPDMESEGSHLVLSADGKGVPIQKKEQQGDMHKPETPKARLTKGEKPGIKKEATVTANYSFNPASRSSEEIVNALLREYKDTDNDQQNQGEQKIPRIALNKHYRASLAGKDHAIGNAIEQLIKRDPDGNKPIIVLIDGAPSLEKSIERMVKTYHIKNRVDATILDIIHACEYVWEAGTAIHGEKSPKRRQWVREKLLDLLDGKIGYVIGALKQIKKKRELNESKLETLDKVIRYFTNHKHMMKYDDYLAKGYPIGTGVVESACGSLVKNRMERNGMRWGMTGAQAMLDLRAVKKNTDWKSFMEIYINEQKNILYSDDYKRKMVA